MSHKVKILLNRTETPDGRLAIFDRFGSEPRYQTGDLLEEVCSFDTDKGGILSLAYEMFNRGAPKFVGDYMYPHRSLSVGDVIEIDGARWSVESVGFAPIIEPNQDGHGIFDLDGHLAELREANEDCDGTSSHPSGECDACDRAFSDLGESSDLEREAWDEREAEGALVVAEESWFGGFQGFIDGHGNGSGRGWS